MLIVPFCRWRNGSPASPRDVEKPRLSLLSAASVAAADACPAGAGSTLGPRGQSRSSEAGPGDAGRPSATILPRGCCRGCGMETRLTEGEQTQLPPRRGANAASPRTWSKRGFSPLLRSALLSHLARSTAPSRPHRRSTPRVRTGLTAALHLSVKPASLGVRQERARVPPEVCAINRTEALFLGFGFSI